MGTEKTFLVFRYFFIEESQRALEVSQLPEPKGRAVLAAILGDREWIKNGIRYSFVGFGEVSPGSHDEFERQRFYIGKLAKLRQAQVGEKVPGDIIEHHEDNWVPLLTVFDVATQTVAVQKDWQFGTPQQIGRALQAGVRGPILSEYNHRVFVEPKPSEGAFWEIIGSHRKIYRIEFNLVSPNILQTNKRAREALRSLKRLYGQDELSLKLKSDSGALTVPENPTSDYINYIEHGEGGWKATTEGDHGGKKTYSSSDVTETVSVDVPEEHMEGEDEAQLNLEGGTDSTEREKRNRSLVGQIYERIRDRIGG
ncbi:hypothetical protein KBTX_02918 [wastewater metagenome]|uniref:Uncharacterized protein n=2 Tax=unclassified sequences TaxID=12908 RepID=A0A5B8RFG0_9ZZZZ|nr:hypothetical protein [Arhodomonas sp. KWT]QEA06578.1 hypothetical protein KBTEX_02918 [uncultured organism]